MCERKLKMVRIVLICMIRNEEKVFKRCIDSAIDLVDGLCICDTGSTDSTVELAGDIIKNSGKPGKIYQYNFVNFGQSRTKSFEYALDFVDSLGWNRGETFGLLLDADMILRYNSFFNKIDLEKFGTYKIAQYVTNNTFYYNIRLIKMSLEWVCEGVTHEAWLCRSYDNGVAIFHENSRIWIEDVDDGGFKSDKFERDRRLLLKGIEDEPSNRCRYYFYLGQTYMCLHEYEKSIECYKTRIDMDGNSWPEEVWMSMYMIVKNYFFLKEYAKMEEWSMKAYQYRPIRADQLIIPCEAFLTLKDYDKVEKYMKMGIDIPIPEKEVLYINKKIYTVGFQYIKYQLQIIKSPDDTESITKSLLCILDKETENIDCLIINIHKNSIPLPICANFDLSHKNIHSLSSFNFRNENYLLLNENLIKDGVSYPLGNFGQRSSVNIFGFEEENTLVYYCTHNNFLEIGIIENMQLVPKKMSDKRFIPFAHGSVTCWFPFTTTHGIVFKNIPKLFSIFDTRIPGVFYKNRTWFLLSCDLVTRDKLISSTMCMFLVLGENDIPCLYHLPFYIGDKNTIKRFLSFCAENDTGIIFYTCGDDVKEIRVDLLALEKNMIQL